jgi:hypothetical protein
LIDNAMFALLIEQLPEARATTLWNLAYDAGYGAAPAVFGLFAARTGYPAAFALTGTLVLAALPAALRERKAVSAPRAWRDHSRARPDAPPAPEPKQDPAPRRRTPSSAPLERPGLKGLDPVQNGGSFAWRHCGWSRFVSLAVPGLVRSVRGR